MKRSFSLAAASSAALVLIASALALPMQANAADRQIVPTAKIKSFTVQDTAEAGATDVAANPEDAAPRRKKLKTFRVEEDSAEQANNGGGSKIKPKSFTVEDESEQAEAAPTVKPKRPAPPKIQEFRVDEDTGEVADTPTVENEEEDVAAAEPAPKPKKLKPAPVEDREEAAAEPDVSEEEQAAAIAGDQPEAAAEEPEVAAAEEDDGEPTILRKISKVSKVKRYKHYQSYDGVQDDYAYQPSAYGSNCHQNYSY